MNERIKELEKQAVFYNEETEKWELNLEKFTELIVRECANIDFRHKVGMTTDQEFETGCVILEHFGVEDD